MRRLSPEERALWKRVAGSVRALRPVAPVEAKGPPPAPPAGVGGEQECTRISSPRLRGGAGGASFSSSANTLDGTWDKRIGTGRVVPDLTIDLHGHTLGSAHHRLDRGLDEAIREGARVVLLVTGRAPTATASRIDFPLRGIIRASVGDWLAASRHVGSIAAVRNAHPRHGGAGALYIVLRRGR